MDWRNILIILFTAANFLSVSPFTAKPSDNDFEIISENPDSNKFAVLNNNGLFPIKDSTDGDKTRIYRRCIDRNRNPSRFRNRRNQFPNSRYFQNSNLDRQMDDEFQQMKNQIGEMSNMLDNMFRNVPQNGASNDPNRMTNPPSTGYPANVAENYRNQIRPTSGLNRQNQNFNRPVSQVSNQNQPDPRRNMQIPQSEYNNIPQSEYNNIPQSQSPNNYLPQISNNQPASIMPNRALESTSDSANPVSNRYNTNLQPATSGNGQYPQSGFGFPQALDSTYMPPSLFDLRNTLLNNLFGSMGEYMPSASNSGKHADSIIPSYFNSDLFDISPLRNQFNGFKRSTANSPNDKSAISIPPGEYSMKNPDPSQNKVPSTKSVDRYTQDSSTGLPARRENLNFPKSQNNKNTIVDKTGPIIPPGTKSSVVKGDVVEVVKDDSGGYYIDGLYVPADFKFTDQILNFYKDEVLKRHHYCRRQHHAPDLKLNDNISKYSQWWADDLQRRNTLEHSPKEKRPNYGENIFWIGLKYVPGAMAVDSWYEEGENVNYDYSTNVPTDKAGHFTQLLWAASNNIGIGVSSGENGIFVVCNYEPHGNVYGEYTRNVLPP